MAHLPIIVSGGVPFDCLIPCQNLLDVPLLVLSMVSSIHLILIVDHPCVPGFNQLCLWKYGGTLFERIHMSFCPLVLNMFWRRKTRGITIDSKLTFESHIEATLGTENQMLDIIRRSFTCCTAEIVIPLYKAIVRQHIEFGVAVWGGFIKRRQLHAIEKVQMRATKIVESVKGMLLATLLLLIV